MSSLSSLQQPTGILYRVDRESLNTLIEQYVTSLTTNASEQERVEKLKQEYVTLRDRLTTLPQQLEYDALVPLGRRAVCPGKIIHTNEIMCLLGDNWFVECSAAKAVEIVNHRIAKLDEQHESLRKEQELINNWKQEAERQLIETIGHGTVEIREDYVEEHEQKWREQHRENVRRYHQQLAKERLEAQQEKGKSGGRNQDVWTRLDELEIQEELEDYLEQESVTEEKATDITNFLSQPGRMIRSQTQRNGNTSVENKVKESDMKSALSKQVKDKFETKQSEKTEEIVGAAIARESLPATTEGKRRVKFSADNIIHDISDDINYSNQETPIKDKTQSKVEEDNTLPTYPCFEPIIIRFRHSTELEDEENYEGALNLKDSSLKETDVERSNTTKNIVSSPGHIVKVFGPTSISAISSKPLPKSILKPFAPPLVTETRSRKSKSPGRNNESTKPSFDDDDLEGVEEAPAVISKVVTERVPEFYPSLQLNPITTTETVPGKPVSLFKMRRQEQLAGVPVTNPD